MSTGIIPFSVKLSLCPLSVFCQTFELAVLKYIR